MSSIETVLSRTGAFVARRWIAHGEVFSSDADKTNKPMKITEPIAGEVA
jgi:hypothetical protein